MSCGYLDEARAWRDWLLRAVAGEPSKLQTLYGAAGARRLTELDLPWLGGYEGSRPVRIGNAAHTQRQLDVYGELMDTFQLARRSKLETGEAGWRLERALLAFLDKAWSEPDEGIWEVRGPRRHFTHSKVMAWVAFDRAIKAIDQFGLEGPRSDWVRRRDQIHAEVCERAFDAKLGAFTQAYGTRLLDASLLMMPLVGFLPADDQRVAGTVSAIERELVVDGFVHRYTTSEERNLDGLRGHEGAFLPCTFWLADNYVLQGRRDEARELFERLVGVANDVGLLAEEYDPIAKRQLGNFPQAFSHVSLINTAHNLEATDGPAKDRHAAGRK
jgi:GH15 family glucan-1,4-alpha-glucosidase